MNDKQARFEALDYRRNPLWRRIFIFLALLPLGYIGLSALYLYLQWDRIPDRYFAGVYTLLIACLILYAAMLIPLFFLTLYRPFKSAEPLDDFPVLRAREKLKGIISMLGVMHWMVLLMCYLSLVLPLAPQLMQKASHRYLDILLVALVAAAFFVPLYFWLRSKLPAGTEEGAEEEKRAQEYLKHWKLGIFYWDPSNPSAVVPRQFGVGYTLNFAARLAWVLLGLILLPTIFLLTILIIFNFVGKMR